VRRLLAVLLVMASPVAATEASAALSSYAQQRFIAGNSNSLRSIPAFRRDSDSVRQPYPPHFYSDESRGVQGCRWLMERAIETKNRNWLQRYRGCAQ
jgi:hypothetical protein